MFDCTLRVALAGLCLYIPCMDSKTSARHSLGLDITAALILKSVILVGLYLLFFRAEERPAIDGTRAAQHLFSSEVTR
jgi:hypothetical protein